MSGRRRGGGEMGGGVGVARNKRGTPMYSREDIREQYCINDKELHALEASRRKPIFGCLTSSNTQPSPCKKKSLLPACLRGRVPSDENVYIKSQSAHTSPAHRKGQETIDYEDDTYFRRRPKTICYTDPRRLASLDDSLAKSGRVSRPRSDTGNTSYESYLNEDAGDANRRPTQLAITSGEYHSTEIYQDDANNREGYTIRRTAFTQPNTPDMGHSTRFHQVTTPEVFLDDRPQKHVSFQKAMSRSATVGGLEDHGAMTRDDSGRGSVRSGGSRSQERLLDGRRTPDYMEQRALDQLLAPVLTKALLQEPGHKRERKHQAEGKRRPGGHQVDSEAGSRSVSRSESRSRSRTPSLKRKKPEKRTIAIQTDDIPYDLDLPDSEGAELRPKGGESQDSKKETTDGDKKAGKRQKKSKKKAIEEVPVEILPKKETVHFSDQTSENVHIVESVDVSVKPVKKPKKKSDSSKRIPEKENSHSNRDIISQVPEKVSSKQTKDNNRKLTDTEIQQDTKHEPRPPDNAKISMGMQTDSMVPFLPTNSIFMTEDLDTSIDWRGEESSVDWQASAGSLAWHTDASSFAWRSDASSYCRQTDASSLSCRADSSFAPESCEEMAEESEEDENILNMDIDLIREKRIKDNPLDETNEDIVWHGGEKEKTSATVQDDVQSETKDVQLPESVDFQQDVENQVIREHGKESVKNKKPMQERGGDSQEDRDTDMMLRRLRFQRKLAEKFLMQNAKEEVRGSHKDIPSKKALEKKEREDKDVGEASQIPKAKKQMDPSTRRKESLPSTSTYPKNANKLGSIRKDVEDLAETVGTRSEMIPLETSRTWPKSLVGVERADDIDLKSFQALSDVHPGTNKKQKEKPSHKTSWLEINLVRKEAERTETPKCVQISNSQLERTEAPKCVQSFSSQLNKAAENNTSKLKAEVKVKNQQQIDISDEYPKSEHDYNTHKTGSLPAKKSSPRSDSSRSLQRRKKVTQKESSDSSTSHHQLDSRVQDTKKLKDVTKVSGSKLNENLSLESSRISSSTDTSSVLPGTDSVGKRMKKSKKANISSQTKDEDTVQDATTLNTNNAHLKEVIEEEVEVKEQFVQESELVVENESSKENETSKSATSSLRRKRSLKRRKSKCIQTEFSYDDPLEDAVENVADERSAIKDTEAKEAVSVASKTSKKVNAKEKDAFKIQSEPESITSKKDVTQDLKSETVSIVTNTSSLRRIKKVRKTTASTQTEGLAQDDLFDIFLQQESQADSVSVRTSSLRRIRKVEKKTVEIQTEESIPICFENLHLSILDFDEFKNTAGLSGVPVHSGSLIYVNIPAAFLEVGESGNDADISDVGSDEDDDYSKNDIEKIYSKVADDEVTGDIEKETDDDEEKDDDYIKDERVIDDDENSVEERSKNEETDGESKNEETDEDSKIGETDGESKNEETDEDSKIVETDGESKNEETDEESKHGETDGESKHEETDEESKNEETDEESELCVDEDGNFVGNNQDLGKKNDVLPIKVVQDIKQYAFVSDGEGVSALPEGTSYAEAQDEDMSFEQEYSAEDVHVDIPQEEDDKVVIPQKEDEHADIPEQGDEQAVIPQEDEQNYLTQEEDEDDPLNQTYTITEEDLARKPTEEEDSSDEDEDFDIYIVDHKHHGNNVSKVKKGEADSGKVKADNSEEIDNKADESCEQEEIIEGDGKEQIMKGNIEGKNFEEAESIQEITYKELRGCYRPSSEEVNDRRSGADDTDEHNNNQEETEEHDSGVSEEDVRDIPYEETLTERWYFGAQDKTFDTAEGSEETKRQDTVIYCPVEDMEDNKRISRTEGNNTEEVQDQEENRVSIARKKFREMRDPFGKGHFSEGDFYQPFVCVEINEDLTSDEIVQAESEGIINSEDDKEDTEPTPTEENRPRTEEKDSGEKQNSDEEEEPVEGNERIKQKEDTDEEQRSDENYEQKVENELGKEREAIGGKKYTSEQPNHDREKEAEEENAFSKEKDDKHQIQDDKKLKEKHRQQNLDEGDNEDDEVTNKMYKENIHEVQSCKGNLTSKILEGKVNKEEVQHSAELKDESVRDSLPSSEKIEGEIISVLEDDSYRNRSPSITKVEDRSYRDGSQSSTRSEDDSFRHRSPASPRYPDDAIGLAFATEYGYTLSEEEDDEVIVFSYKKVRQTRDDDRLWKSEENLIQQDEDKRDNKAQHIDREAESKNINQEVRGSNERIDKENNTEAVKEEGKAISVRPKKKRQKKKPTGNEKEKDVAEELPRKEETPKEEMLYKKVEIQKEEELPKKMDTQKQKQLPKKEEIEQAKQLPKEEEIQKEKQLPKKEEIQKEKQLPKEEDIQKEKQLPKKEEIQKEKQLPKEEEVQKEKQLPKKEEIRKEKQLPKEEEIQKEKQLPKKEEIQKEKQLLIKEETPKEKQLPKKEETQREKQLLKEEQQLAPEEKVHKEEGLQKKEGTIKELDGAEVKKKKRRPRYRKKKNKPEAAKEIYGEDMHDESLLGKSKSDLEVKETEQKEDSVEVKAPVVDSERNKKHKMWVDEVEENLSNEWRSYDKKVENDGLKEKMYGFEKTEPAMGAMKLEDDSPHETHVYPVTEIQAREREDEEETYGEDGEESSHYDGDSSRYEEDSEVGEGGGEQNAYEEYLLIKEGDCQEEMKEVDRIFRDVLKDYADAFSTDDEDMSQMPREDIQSFNYKKDEEEYVDPGLQGAIQCKGKGPLKEKSSGAKELIVGNVALVSEGLSDEKNVEKLTVKSEEVEKIPRGKKSKKIATTQPKKGEDLSRPADNIEG